MWLYVGYRREHGAVYYSPEHDKVRVQAYERYAGRGKTKWRYEVYDNGLEKLREWGF